MNLMLMNVIKYLFPVSQQVQGRLAHAKIPTPLLHHMAAFISWD